MIKYCAKEDERITYNNMDYDFYKRNYSGNCVNIAVVDCGIVSNIVNCKRHYMVRNDEVIEMQNGFNELIDYHGTYCALEIKKVAQNAEIFDFNVADENHKISEKSIICALKFILNLDIDIINISMKLISFSKELLNVMEEVYKRSIFLLASADREVSYPADMKFALSIRSRVGVDDILHVNEKSVYIGKNKYSYLINNRIINLEPSASLACAYYAGVLALVLEGSVLLSFKQICKRLGFFQFQPEQTHETFALINDNTVIIDTSHELSFFSQFSEFLDDKIIGIYEAKKDCFLSLKKEVIHYEQVEHIIEINSEHYQKQPMSNQTRFCNVPYQLLGNFTTTENSLHIKEYDNPDVEFIKYIDKPIIYITSLACGTQKFETLLQLQKQLMNGDVHVGSITSNPLGNIMGISTYQYPKEIIFPKIIYQINQTLDNIARIEDIDMLLADIPGGMAKLNWHNQNNFGMLFKAFLMAADVDIVLIMLNEGLVWNDIEKEIQVINSSGVPNIIFCISELAYDMSSIESETGVRLVKNGCEKNEFFYQEAVEHLSGYKVFRFSELLDGELVRYILNLYQQ